MKVHTASSPPFFPSRLGVIIVCFAHPVKIPPEDPPHFCTEPPETSGEGWTYTLLGLLRRGEALCYTGTKDNRLDPRRRHEKGSLAPWDQDGRNTA